jgi:hypothetical protein
VKKTRRVWYCIGDMGKFYLDRRYYAGKETKWVSFESTPTLTETKRDIYGKCVPCITNLYEQLRDGKTLVNLGPAYRCWKVVAVMATDDECLQLLAEFETRFLGEKHLKGRFGSGDETKSTKVIVFSVVNEIDRENLKEQVRTCAKAVSRNAQVFSHRGCAELYHELFGDPAQWDETESIKKPEAVPAILAHIREMLYWEKGQNPGQG